MTVISTAVVMVVIFVAILAITVHYYKSCNFAILFITSL
jgi:hypothetical protein